MTIIDVAIAAATEDAGAVGDDSLAGDLLLRPTCESCRRTPSTVTVRWQDEEFTVCAGCAVIIQDPTAGGQL